MLFAFEVVIYFIVGGAKYTEAITLVANNKAHLQVALVVQTRLVVWQMKTNHKDVEVC